MKITTLIALATLASGAFAVPLRPPSFKNHSKKRAVSQSSSSDFPKPQVTQDAYPAVDQNLTIDAKLDEGREALNQVRAYLDDKDKIYSTTDSLPDVFNHAWKIIMQYSLPMKFRKGYMDMVREYLSSAPYQPGYPQDGSGHIPVDLNARVKLARRQEDPAWLKKFIFPEIDNALLRRADDGYWFDGKMIREFDEDLKHGNTVDVDRSSSWKRGLPKEDEASPLHIFHKIDNEKPSPEYLQDATDINYRIESLADNQTNHTLSGWKHGLSVNDKTMTLPVSRTNGTNHSFPEEALLEILAFIVELQSATGIQSSQMHFGWKRNVGAEGKPDLSKELLRSLYTQGVGAEILSELRNQAYSLRAKNLARPFEDALGAWNSSREYFKLKEPDLSENVRKLQDEIGAEIKEPYNDITKPFAEFENPTEHDIDFLASKTEDVTAAASQNFNSSSDFEQSGDGKSDLLADFAKLENEIGAEVNKPDNETKNATEEAFEPLASEVKNLTSHMPGKLSQSSVDAHSGKQAAKRSNVLSIDGEEAYRRYHAKYRQGVNTYKRQTTPEQAFSQEASEQAFQRYVEELEQLNNPRNGYQPLSATEQDKIRNDLREKLEEWNIFASEEAAPSGS